VSIYKRGCVWWLYVTDPRTGQRIRKSTRQRDRARGKRIHDEFKAELWKRRGSESLHGALQAWAEGKGEPDRYRVGKLLRLLPDGGLELTPAAVAKIPQKTPGTFNRYVNILAAAGARGLEHRKPPRGRIRWLTAEEWTALRAALPEQWVSMADFAIATGLRQANVFWLEWAQVDMTRRKAWVHSDEAKGGEPIGIPLSDDAMAVLERQRGRSAVWVFPMRDGNPLPKLKTRDWKAVVKAADIAYCTWHDLRHTWATWHLMNEPPTPLEVLQRLGGWKDLRMVLRYAHLAQSYVDQYAGNARPYSHNPGHSEKLSA
jgi:integrase